MVEISRVEGDELLKLSDSLKEKSENIYSTYRKACAPALEMSAKCLQTTGLDTAELINAFEEIYKKLHERLDEFATFLNDTVLAEYNAVQEAIVSNFNRNFGAEMAGILGISYQGPIASDKFYPIEGETISIPAMPGTPIPINPGNPSISPIRRDEGRIRIIPGRRDEMIRVPVQPVRPIITEEQSVIREMPIYGETFEPAANIDSTNGEYSS